MKSYFRLYTDNKLEYNSSIFDLIDGDKETKQTKGLAYILANHHDFLFYFLDYKPICDSIRRKLNNCFDKKTITTIEVSAERVSSNKKRADIIVKIDSNDNPFFALIIEAKSIKVNSNAENLRNQLLYYLDENQFPDLIHYQKIGIALTKYKHNLSDIICLTWDDIIQLLFDYCKKRNSSEIVLQYMKFLTQIDKAMKYYEKEVLSIPAGRSFNLVERFKIYACPDTNSYNYKKAIFLGFRNKGGGVMDKLYKLDDIIVFNPTVASEIETFKNSIYPGDVKQRILDYIESSFKNQLNYNMRFYVLSESDNIELKNKPKPLRNNVKFTYFTLSEVISKQIITPESQK